MSGHDGHEPMQPHAFNRLFQKGLGSFGIPPRREADVDHLTIRTHSPPQVSPFSANPDLGLIDVLIDACPAQMLFSSFGNFRAELDHPTIHSRPINGNPAFCQQFYNVLIGYKQPQIPADRAQNDLLREAMMFER